MKRKPEGENIVEVINTGPASRNGNSSTRLAGSQDRRRCQEDRGREQTEGVVGKSVCSTPKRRVL